MKLKKRFLPQRYVLLLFILAVGISSTLLSLKQFGFNIQKPFQDLDEPAVKGLLVDTPGCKIPQWDPWDASVKRHYSPVHPYDCPGGPSFLRVEPRGIVTIDGTILQFYYEVQEETVSCVYQAIHRGGKEGDFTLDFHFTLGPLKNLSFGVPLDDEFIKTVCSFPAGGEGPDLSFTEYLALTPLKASSKAKKVAGDQKEAPFNVLFLGIDSISNLNFVRHFPKTRKYLLENLSPLTLQGYTKVGDNTFPNLVPLLTGHFYQDFWNESANKTMYFDDLPYLWREFANSGYVTLLAEDAPEIATFNYYRSGFKKPPTDYYYRPFALAVEESEFRSKQCYGNKMEMEVAYDYLRNFLQTINGTQPFFAFVFTARLTHDVFNFAGYADEPAYRLLRFLKDSKVLDNTLLVFYSDHGIRFSSIRYSHIGRFEERMPFVHLVFPPRFLRKHKRIAKNLEVNQNRLTTPFDIHATLQDFLNPASLDVKDESVLTTPAISLFNEVSPHRTCQHASITPHWCTCQLQKPVSVENRAVVRAAATVVSTLNEWTKRVRDRCSLLVLERIHAAREAETGEAAFNFESSASSTTEYLVVLSTTPGQALFEATVRCVKETRTCSVMDEISRINRYGNQSYCVDNTVLKKYCYCISNSR